MGEPCGVARAQGALYCSVGLGEVTGGSHSRGAVLMQRPALRVLYLSLCGCGFGGSQVPPVCGRQHRQTRASLCALSNAGLFVTCTQTVCRAWHM